MVQPERFQAVNRRGFLKTLGAVAGALTLPALGLFEREASASPSLAGVSGKVELLLSPSGDGSWMERSVTAGMRLALEAANAQGASLRMKTGLATRRSDADLLVGVAGPNAALDLHQSLDAKGTPLLVVDTGANLARTEEQRTGLFHNNLGYWRSNWAMGEWAARHLGRRAFVAASFQESGYDAIDALETAFAAAGGEVVESRITHIPPQPFRWDSLMAAIREAQPDVVFALYSGPLAAEFVQAYARSGLSQEIPLAASPFLVDEALLAGTDTAAAGIYSCHTWAPGLKSEANETFDAAYRALTGEAPDGFALLGYEAGQLAIQALAADGGARLTAALAAAQLASPRGRLRMDAATRTADTPVYLRQVRTSPAGLRSEVVAALPAPTALDPRLEPLRSSLRTGWLNSHLSV